MFESVPTYANEKLIHVFLLRIIKINKETEFDQYCPFSIPFLMTADLDLSLSNFWSWCTGQTSKSTDRYYRVIPSKCDELIDRPTCSDLDLHWLQWYSNRLIKLMFGANIQKVVIATRVIPWKCDGKLVRPTQQTLSMQSLPQGN